MKEYIISYWYNHGEESLIIVQALNIEDLYSKLQKEYNEEILISGFNYNYITNLYHCQAAGFPITDPSIGNNLHPAHINRNFFYILNVQNVENNEKS